MEVTLEKIELVKDRTGVSYKEAKEALEKTEGNVVDAIILIEETIDEAPKKSNVAGDAFEKVKAAVKKGNVNKIRISKDGEAILNLPVTIGIAGTLIFPWAAVASTLAAFGTKCKVELIKEDGTSVDVTEKAVEAVDAVKAKGGVIADELKDKGGDYFEAAKEKGGELFDKAKDKGGDYFEAAMEKGGELFDKAKEKVADIKNGTLADEFDLSDLDLEEVSDEAVEDITSDINIE